MYSSITLMKSTFSLISRLFIGLAGFGLLAMGMRAQTITGTAGQVGVAYTYQVTSTATPPLQYTATGLPAGLAINASSGLITGSPTASGTAVGTVSITSNGLVNSAAISIAISAAAGTPSISSATTLSLTAGTGMSTYMVTATVPSGANPVTSFNVGTLPAGLALGGTTLAPTISGTPTTATNGTPVLVSLSANSAGGAGATTTLSITIASALGTPVITSADPSPLTVSAAMTPYQIVAINSPTAYAVSGLPVGLSLNAVTGLISGTPSVAGIYAVSVNAANGSGTGTTVSLAFTVGLVSAINSVLAVNGTVGTGLNYTLTGTNTPSSFNIGKLPAGLIANTTSGAISGTPTVEGVTSLSVSANNATGAGATATLVITIVVAPTGGGSSGGNSGGGSVISGGGNSSVPVPVIASQPSSQAVLAGASVTFSVSATGTGLNFQWFKAGAVISGAQSASLTIANVSSSDAAAYTVAVSNGGGAVTSAAAVLTLSSKVEAPTITTAPIAQTVDAGASASFTVVAAGTGPLTYQWQKDGVAIAGAAGAFLTVANATASASYRVVISNSAGSVTSSAAALTVRPPVAVVVPINGTYFGSFGGNGGSFALQIAADRSGVFLGFASAARVALVSRGVVVDALGRFSVTQPIASGFTPGASPATAALDGEYRIDGTIAADGTVTGTVSALNLTFAAPAAVRTGTTAAIAGFYPTSAAGSAAQGYALVSPAGQVLVVNVVGAVADGGVGTVSAEGAVALTTAGNARVAGSVAADATTITTTVTPATGAATSFVGANSTRKDTEKLTNISSRTSTGTPANTLIAGFIVSGTQAKPVLIRGIGPSLGLFDVKGALSAVRLEVFRDTTSLAVGTDWGLAANAATIAATASRVGAFPLANNSRDASLLLNLEAGSYTAVVTGQAGASGVASVEVYDATNGVIANDQRIINISTRATAGVGENILIAGFYVSGTVPKRLLIRGAGPSLTQFGVGGALARPVLSVLSAATVVATNTGWSSSPDAPAIASAFAQAGAYAFSVGSQDSALVINLAPGSYTAQVQGVGNTTGVALIEVYELP